MKCFKFIFLFVFFVSCDDIVGVNDISDETLTILAPTNGSTLIITDVTFSWNSVEDAEQYKLQVATPNFVMANQIILDTLVASTNFSQPLELGNYEWRVRAENSEYQTDYSTQNFTIEE